MPGGFGAHAACATLAHSGRTGAARRRGQRHGRFATPELQPVLEHIALHLDSPLGVDALARVAGMSRARLQRQFKAALGVPVHHRYVVTRRAEFARELLARGELPAAQAAAAAGFAHQSHMTRWLKRLKSVT
ncbi:MAG: AraC family transcriptional regulator [Pseudomonadota bacterium]